jgi:hypothetical protein
MGCDFEAPQEELCWLLALMTAACETACLTETVSAGRRLSVLTLTMHVAPLVTGIAIACEARMRRVQVLAGISLGIFDAAARTSSTPIHLYRAIRNSMPGDAR